MSIRTHVEEGARIFSHSIARKIRGHRNYPGTSLEICRKVVRDCWNGNYFTVSSGHFCQFYSRDFGLCAEALLKLGYSNEIKKTLRFALETFRKKNSIAVALTPSGKPFDFPYYAIDSIPFMIRTLAMAKDNEIVDDYREFLNSEISKLFSIAIDKDTGLVKKNIFFSSIKDHAKRKCSCYDNVMIGMLKEELDRLNLTNPFKSYNYKKIIRDNFWNGSYFIDELNGEEYVSGDSNIFPFWTNLFTSREMLKKSLNSIISAGLDEPFPLKYVNEETKQKMIHYELLVRGWQADAIWMQMGPIYIKLLKKADKNRAEKHMRAYKSLIESNKNYIEVFDSKGKPFRTPFYRADEGMIWASLFLELEKE